MPRDNAIRILEQNADHYQAKSARLEDERDELLAVVERVAVWGRVLVGHSRFWGDNEIEARTEDIETALTEGPRAAGRLAYIIRDAEAQLTQYRRRRATEEFEKEYAKEQS